MHTSCYCLELPLCYPELAKYYYREKAWMPFQKVNLCLCLLNPRIELRTKDSHRMQTKGKDQTPICQNRLLKKI